MTASPIRRQTMRLAFLAVLGALPLPAAAQSADPAPGFPVFAEMDADGNGAVTAEEWAAFVEARRNATPEDRALRRAQALVARFDTDGDSLLGAAELVAAHARIDGMRGHGGRDGMGRGDDRRGRHDHGGRDGHRMDPAAMRGDMPDPARLFARVDADGDGAISPAEFEDAARMLRRGFGRME